MRKENWPHLLAEQIAACKDRVFAYGVFDCFLFAAECVQSITGIDYAEKFRGYESRKDAYKIIAGYGSMQAMITSILSEEPKPVSFAHRGDVVLSDVTIAKGQTAEAVGICDGVFSLFAAPVGIVKVKTLSSKKAWSID